MNGGILRGVRGPYGGYEFACDRNAVTLIDILHAVSIGEAKEPQTSEIATKIVLPILSVAQQAFEKTLTQVNLEDLIRYAKAAEVDCDQKLGDLKQEIA